MFKDDISNLSKYSNKKILCTCDFCKKDYYSRLSIINRSSNPEKHSCSSPSCRKAKVLETSGYTGFKDSDIQKKIKEKILDKYNVNNISELDYVKEKKKQKYREKNNGKMISEWAESVGKSISTMGQQISRYGLDVALKIKNKSSGLELKFESILKKNNLQYIKQYKVGKYIADFLIDNKLIIETNGLYWHSDAIIRNKNYHKEKKDEYTKCSYYSMFFYEDEVNTKIDIIESMLLNKLQKSEKIYARKCKIELLKKNDIDKFLSQNHLMGTGQGKAVALLDDGEIVCCLQFINKKNNIEISRFCNKLNVAVIGGFSKLLLFLEKTYNKNISTFIDARYGSGSYLPNLGFVKTNESISFKWVNNSGKTFHRMRFPNNSGYKNNMNKIWDCGQIRYIKYIKGNK